MSTAVSLFIIVFTLANVAACVWLLWWTQRKPLVGETTGHVWDGDLTEYNNPLPRWWLWLFYITVIFSLIYLVIYPGLGGFSGTKGWSQIVQYDAEVERMEEKTRALFAPFADMSLEDLSRNATAMSAAANLYGVNCATCHGADARGARGFPNLTDREWLWGGEPEVIYQSIAHGRVGVMPALGEALGPQGTDEVVAYVLSLSGREAPADWVAAGKTRFETLCAACHGADGKGMRSVGAPDLTNDIWMHGGSVEVIRDTVMQGRQNQMPAQLSLLGEMRVRLLAAYVLSLNADGAGRTAMAARETVQDRDR